MEFFPVNSIYLNRELDVILVIRVTVCSTACIIYSLFIIIVFHNDLWEGHVCASASFCITPDWYISPGHMTCSPTLLHNLHNWTSRGKRCTLSQQQVFWTFRAPKENNFRSQCRTEQGQCIQRSLCLQRWDGFNVQVSQLLAWKPPFSENCQLLLGDPKRLIKFRVTRCAILLPYSSINHDVITCPSAAAAWTCSQIIIKNVLFI